ncbi:spore maturation protein B [Clostridium polyendosporum]|uniref:Spore maturation protein B n=1 Tax=Clostridium polyendosporum TaxID=69208 RepID=A0A919RZ60_9CLOT|nr:nucleoside recognition domain-containing protein [Clostridium polyendosporum]GIM29016.1 spore maturation protein B [Clostridium polyendosporum]
MFIYLLKSIIPLMFIIIIAYGMVTGKKVYEWFVEGAKEGLKVNYKIFPYLLSMIIAVRIFKEARLLDMINNFLAPVVGLIGLPREIVPLILVKPISGSGALGVFTEILKEYGPDSYIGVVASVIMGTTETIFYTITIYYGAVGVKKIRHTLWAAIMADLTAIIMAVTIVRYFL